MVVHSNGAQMKDKLRQIAQALQSARSVVALTGAGVSKESGIPTFRDAQTGLWANFNPEELATPRAFKKNPSLVWKWYDFRREAVKKVEPNAGHYALVQLEERVKKFVLITQNVDGLHLQAGSKDIIELHGNIRQNKCFDHEHPAEDVPCGLEEPPRCHCGSLIRPNVVWFEEALPQAALSRAFAESTACDVMLVIGTSGLVQPAASLPLTAKRERATLIEINPDRTPITPFADIYLGGASGEMLPLVVKELDALND
jgi:NAD-dependent deacetylase